jgi:hypothetical protein
LVLISTWANLHNQRAKLAFVDVDTRTDLRLFVDPYALEIRQDHWSRQCTNLIRSFFDELLQALRAGNNARAIHLASHLRETNETCLGYSTGRPQGRGIGANQANDLLLALRQSRAFQTGVLSDLSETALFIDGIGSDKISDLTTNIIRGQLLAYTKEQAQLWNMQLTADVPMSPVWDMQRLDWVQEPRETIVINGRPILLVPKHCVRLRIGIDAQEFYNNHMIVALQQEYLNARQALVTVLKSGERRVYKKDVKERHPFFKDHLADFVHQHPDVLEQYKKLAGAKGALDDEELYRGFDEADYARSLQQELRNIPSGNDHATAYHRYCIGALTFIFYPELVNPYKEREIDDRRKRIDIAFQNPGISGFFETALKSPQMRAIEIPIECKNYSKDAANPELDQLAGRFSHVRGFLGILCSRSFKNRVRFIERCKDSAAHRQHYIIPIVDDDILRWLEFIAQSDRDGISNDLRRRFAEITS